MTAAVTVMGGIAVACATVSLLAGLGGWAFRAGLCLATALLAALLVLMWTTSGATPRPVDDATPEAPAAIPRHLREVHASHLRALERVAAAKRVRNSPAP